MSKFKKTHSSEDLHLSEYFLRDLKKTICMTVYRNRGFNIIEAEVKKANTDNNDDNEKEKNRALLSSTKNSCTETLSIKRKTLSLTKL